MRRHRAFVPYPGRQICKSSFWRFEKNKNTPLRVGKRFDKLCPRSPEKVSDRSLKVDIGENSNVCVRSYESSARDFQTKNFLFLRV